MTHSSTNDKAAHQNQKTPCRIPKVSLVAATLALSLSATATLATPSLTINNMQSVGSVEFRFSENPADPFLIGYDGVNLRFDYDYNPDARKNHNDWWQGIRAGAFDGEAKSAGNEDFDITTLYRSQDQVILYCLDIFNDLETAGFVEYSVYAFDDDAAGAPTTTTQRTITRGPWWWPSEETITATGNLNNVLDFLGAVNDVLEDQYQYTFGDRNWLNPADRWISGAIQVGIWESLYDDYDSTNTSLDITDGHFSVTGLSNKGETLLSHAFNQMVSSESLDRSQVLLFQPVTGGQTLIGDPFDVPAPGTLVLLLSGLFLVRKVSRGSR